MRPAKFGGRERTLYGIGGEVIEFLEFLRRPLPVTDVRFIPKLPVPALHFSTPVPCDCMTHPLVDQLGPLGVIARRMRPPCVDRTVRFVDSPLVLVGLRFH